MLIEREELLDLYCGRNDLPGEWMTVNDVAERLGIGSDEVRDLLRFYGIKERLPEIEVFRVVWNILCEEWYMEHDSDFSYNVNLFHVIVHFLIEADGIGFNLDPTVPEKMTILFHIHSMNIFRVNPNLVPEALGDTIRKILKDSKVRKRSRLNVKEKNSIGW